MIKCVLFFYILVDNDYRSLSSCNEVLLFLISFSHREKKPSPIVFADVRVYIYIVIVLVDIERIVLIQNMQTEKVIEHITKWLKDYQQNSRTKGFVVGVSGGVDSAVVSTLCARTGAPVLVLEMPIRQSSNEVNRSHAHINWLKSNFPNVTGGEVNLTEIFETFEKTVKKHELNETNSASEIAFANMRSRLRMVRFAIILISIDLSFFFNRLIYIILHQLKIILSVEQEIKSKISVSDFSQNTAMVV